MRTFKDLPPRVIIHIILPYYEFTIPEVLINKCALYGYFKRDMGRHIWDVFTSIGFSHKSERKNIFINLCRLYHLKLYDPTAKMLEILKSESSKMYSLKSLTIEQGERDSFSSENAFYLDSRFPKLKYFEYTNFSDHEFGSNWHLCDNFFPKLEKLFVLDCSEFKNVEFLKSPYFGKVKRLRLNHLRPTGVGTVDLKIPKLKELTLEFCENLSFTTEGEIRYIGTFSVKQDFIQPVIQNSRFLRSLEAYTTHPHENCFFFDRVNPLSHLKKIRFRNYRFTEKDVENFYQLKDQLEIIDISQKSLQQLRIDIFNRKKYESLKSLKMLCEESVLSSSECVWPLSQNIRIFWVTRCNDMIFQKNDWPFLQELVVAVTNCTGVKWGKFPKLRSLYIRNANLFEDAFFEEHDEMKDITNIKIRLCKKLKGTKWNKSVVEGLKSLKMYIVPGVEDSFFQVNDFVNLKELVVEDNPKLEGNDWLEMKKLKVFETKRCQAFRKEK